MPVNAARDADGRGLGGRNWPRAQEVPVEHLREQDIDMVILQRPHELELVHKYLGRRPDIDVPAVYVEHNAPHPHTARWTSLVVPAEAAREVAITHFSLDRFLSEWDQVIDEVCAPT